MPNGDLTIEQLGQKVKSKAPQFQGLSDFEVGQNTLLEYPQYAQLLAPTEADRLKKKQDPTVQGNTLQPTQSPTNTQSGLSSAPPALSNAAPPSSNVAPTKTQDVSNGGIFGGLTLPPPSAVSAVRPEVSQQRHTDTDSTEVLADVIDVDKQVKSTIVANDYFDQTGKVAPQVVLAQKKDEIDKEIQASPEKYDEIIAKHGLAPQDFKSFHDYQVQSQKDVPTQITDTFISIVPEAKGTADYDNLIQQTNIGNTKAITDWYNTQAEQIKNSDGDFETKAQKGTALNNAYASLQSIAATKNIDTGGLTTMPDDQLITKALDTYGNYLENTNEGNYNYWKYKQAGGNGIVSYSEKEKYSNTKDGIDLLIQSLYNDRLTSLKDGNETQANDDAAKMQKLIDLKNKLPDYFPEVKKSLEDENKTSLLGAVASNPMISWAVSPVKGLYNGVVSGAANINKFIVGGIDTFAGSSLNDKKANQEWFTNASEAITIPLTEQEKTLSINPLEDLNYVLYNMGHLYGSIEAMNVAGAPIAKVFGEGLKTYEAVNPLAGGVGTVVAQESLTLPQLAAGAFVTAYPDAWNQLASQGITDPNALDAFATANAGLNAMWMTVLTKPIKGLLGITTQEGAVAFQKTLASTGSTAEAVKKLSVIWGKNVSEALGITAGMEATNLINNHVANLALGKQVLPDKFDAKEFFENVIKGTLPLAGLGLIGGITELNNLQKSALLKSGFTPEETIKGLDESLKNGSLNQKQYDDAVTQVKLMRTAVDSVPPDMPEAHKQDTILANYQFQKLQSRNNNEKIAEPFKKDSIAAQKIAEAELPKIASGEITLEQFTNSVNEVLIPTEVKAGDTFGKYEVLKDNGDGTYHVKDVTSDFEITNLPKIEIVKNPKVEPTDNQPQDAATEPSKQSKETETFKADLMKKGELVFVDEKTGEPCAKDGILITGNGNVGGWRILKELKGDSHAKGGIDVKLKGEDVVAEGNELVLTNDAGAKAIIPKKDKQLVKSMIDEGCHSCLQSYVGRLPRNPDVAANGGVYDNNTPPSCPPGYHWDSGVGKCVENQVWNFASGIPQGVPVQHDFTITNTSKKPMVINAADCPSCNHTNATYDKSPLMPGQSRIITISYTPTSGFTESTVTLKTDVGDIPLTINNGGGSNATVKSNSPVITAAHNSIKPIVTPTYSKPNLTPLNVNNDTTIPTTDDVKLKPLPTTTVHSMSAPKKDFAINYGADGVNQKVLYYPDYDKWQKAINYLQEQGHRGVQKSTNGNNSQASIKFGSGVTDDVIVDTLDLK